ncbi:UNVERIFIED_CONTAM: hypothetical protein HDU68_008712 [Siphonaria sp. JEL0065]|nr:hypothetical protein HDU68_008712 [Siphonaria sp. JEL0065]
MLPNYDCIVVGAGPSGLCAAAEMLRTGLSPASLLVIDLNQVPLKLTKGAAIFSRTLEQLASFHGVREKLDHYALQFHDISWSNNGIPFGRIPLSQNASTMHHGLMCEQWFTEQVLSEYLAERGVSVARGVEMASYKYIGEDGESDLEVVLNTPNGIKTIVVKYLVGSDGAHSLTRKAAGIDFHGTTLQDTMYCAHFSVKKTLSFVKPSIAYALTKDGMSFITQMPNDTYFIALDLCANNQSIPFLSQNEKDSYGNPKLLAIPDDVATTFIHQRINPSIQVDKMIWTTHFRINQRVAEKYSDGQRVFLVGDAAHVNTPVGGQGQNLGMQEGINLGWKLSFVLQGKIKSEILATYQLERLPISSHVVHMTSKVQHSISSRHPVFQLVRWRLMAFVMGRSFIRNKMAKVASETIYDYRASNVSVDYACSGKACGVKAGDRVTGFLLPSVGESFFAQTAGFKLLLFTGVGARSLDSKDRLKSLGETLIRQSSGIISAFTIIDSALDHEKCGAKEQSILLVRPDGHVGLHTHVVTESVIRGYLRNVIGFEGFEAELLFDDVKTKVASKNNSNKFIGTAVAVCVGVIGYIIANSQYKTV